MTTAPTLTAYTGTNADLLPQILGLYVPEGSTVADVTWGRGVFWRNVDTSKYDLLASDIDPERAPICADLSSLPYEDRTVDCLLLDPPYMHGGKSVKQSLKACYNNHYTERGHESIIRLYGAGILEAARVLRQGGTIVVKSQDETESGKQRLSHVALIQVLELFGFQVIDLFVLVQKSTPMMRYKSQKSARKNHSYAIVGRFRR